MGIDLGAVDAPVPWPVVPGCVTGLPPSVIPRPGFPMGPLVVGCGGLTRTLVNLEDAFGQGFIFTAALDRPLPGFQVSPAQGVVCSGGPGAPIKVIATESPVLRPGFAGIASLIVTIQGPGSPMFRTQFEFSILATDFNLTNDMIDFGLVPVGSSRSTEVVVLNSPASPAIQMMYTLPQAEGPFSFSTAVVGRPSSLPLEPGQTAPMLTAYFYSNTVGSFTSTFMVSPFQPGIPLDPACSGTPRTLTLHGQAYMPRGAGPPIP